MPETKQIKTKVLEKLISFFESELEALTLSAVRAHEAATHEELKAEDRHDTQAIEASYLAAGQAARISDLTKVLFEFRTYRETALKPQSEIAIGAFLILKSNGKTIHTIFAKSGGGSQIILDDSTITVTTLDSPLGQALLSARQGEEVEVEAKNGLRLYQILEIL